MPGSNEQAHSGACRVRNDEQGVALQLGRYSAGVNARLFDHDTREAVYRCVLDAITSAAAALDQPGVQAAQRAACVVHGSGESPLWFSGYKASVGAAMLANSTATAALDLDDGYRAARGHPGAAVIPAALALLLSQPSVTVDDFLAAVVAGYEVGVRMAMARLSYAPSGAWSGFAVVACAGRLLGAPAEVIAHALAIVVQTAPAMPVLAGIAGSDVKEGIPAGVAAGWSALQLALAGYSGPLCVLDDRRLFDSHIALRNLNAAPLIGGTYFKRFGCCRHIHAPLEALMGLQAVHGVQSQDVAGIEVFTYQATFNLSNMPRPRTLVDAQYSTPYCLALCLLRGADALLPLTIDGLRDEAVGDLAQRITVTHDEAIEHLFPARSPARVAVVLANGQRFESALTDPRGDPDRPLSWADLVHKLSVATASTLSPTRRQAVLDGMAGLRAGDSAILSNALSA